MIGISLHIEPPSYYLAGSGYPNGSANICRIPCFPSYHMRYNALFIVSDLILN